jgi:hypothetical protein
MAKVDLGTIADGLFLGFMAPLVIGGEMIPRRPIGGRAALALGVERSVTDPDRLAHVQIARIRVARKLAPIDRVENPTVDEWALSACLHDLVQATHPSLVGIFRGKAPGKLLQNVDVTLGQIPAAKTAHEALSRHTWFSRLFEIARTDTVVSWWVGSRTFLGTSPPERLTAWPELRRVQVDRTPRSLAELPEKGGAVDKEQFLKVLQSFLGKVPLTDLANVTRAEPAFAWTREALELVGSRAGRTLATRALLYSPEDAVASALGRATRQLFAVQSWKAAEIAMTLLGELVLTSAQIAIHEPDGKPPALYSKTNDDALFARSAGAFVAMREIAMHGEAFGAEQRARMLALLTPLANTPAGKEIAAMLEPPARAALPPKEVA